MEKGSKKRTRFVDKLNFFNNPDTAQLRNIFFVYGSSLLISIGVSSTAIFLTLRMEGFSPLLILLIPVIVSSWYGEFASAVFSLILTAFFYFGYIYFLPHISTFKPIFDLNVFLQIILLILEGVFLSLIIDKSKKTDEVTKYKRESIRYAQRLVKEEKANIQALEEIRARDELLSMASHELKTPLTLVLLQIQKALHNIRNVSLANFSVGKLLEMLESVEQQTKRLSRMISDMLNVSIITTGKLNLEIEETDLVKIVRDVSKRLPQTLNRRRYSIKLDLEDSVVGYWDKIRIEQVVVNIMSNAIKYGNNKPIEVKVEKYDGLAKLLVKDHGIGISKDTRKRIFERFERGVSNKDYQGLGVGLYITSQIIKAHQGAVTVDSKENKGSTFIVELPIKKKS